MKGPYRKVGTEFNRVRTDINANTDDIYSDIKEVAADAKKTVNTAIEARSSAIDAKAQSQRAEAKADRVRAEFNEVIADGDSNAEVVASRVANDGVAKASLPERLASDAEKVSKQISEVDESVGRRELKTKSSVKACSSIYRSSFPTKETS